MGEVGSQNTWPRDLLGDASNVAERTAHCRKRASELLEEASRAPKDLAQHLRNTADVWLALAKHIEGRR